MVTENVIVAIDPGKHASGVAVLSLSGRFLWAGMATEKSQIEYKVIAPSLVIEVPQVYARARSKGNPNDLIDVAFAAGCWSGMWPNAELEVVRPAAWKGNVPKAIHQARVLSAMGDATVPLHEFALRVKAALRHNVFDAACLAWWKRNKILGEKK